MFVKKNVKMHSVACQLSVRQVLIASFWNPFVYQLYTQRKIYLKCRRETRIQVFFFVFWIHKKKLFLIVKPKPKHTAKMIWKFPVKMKIHQDKEIKWCCLIQRFSSAAEVSDDVDYINTFMPVSNTGGLH